MRPSRFEEGVISTIYQTLNGCLTGQTLNLPATAFGAGAIQDVIQTYFGTNLVIASVSLVPTGDGVTFEKAVIASAPLTGMTVSASFQPADSGVQMMLTMTPPAGWNFAMGWPLLAGSWLASLGLGNATFTLVSLASGGLSKGLNFNGQLVPGSDWSPLLWLMGGSETFEMTGPIGQTGAVPTFSFTSSIAGPIHIPVLGDLSLSLQLSCAAISGAVVPPLGGAARVTASGSGPTVSAWVPSASFGLEADLVLSSTVSIPIFIDLSAPDGPVTISADVTAGVLVGFADFASLLPGINFQSVLPSSPNFDPGTVFTLRELSLCLLPKSRSVSSVGIALGTTAAWSVTNGISVGPITLQFQVQTSTGDIAASLIGAVGFDGGSLQLGAYYPGFIFTGDLAPGSQIDLTALMNKVLPIQLDATLILDEFDFVVQPTDGSFSLTTGLTGDWSISVGLATIELTEAWMQLDRSNGSTSGAIGLQGNLAIEGQPDPITFSGSWALPGGFSLEADFPAINFTQLAATLTGASLPTGVPEIALADGVLVIALNPTTGDYGFSLGATARINGTPIGSGVFQVRRGGNNPGYLVGFVIPENWSPASLWSGLGDLFGGLSFSDSGLVISSLPAGTAVALPNMQMPSLPATVNPGFTFFSTLTLTSGILAPLGHLFSDDPSFRLLAVVDTANPQNSIFEAIFADSNGKGLGSVNFTGITVTLKPGAESFSIAAGAVIKIHSEMITVEGSGTITLTPTPGFTFTIQIENWEEPFGIKGLTVREFGLQVGLKDSQPTAGFLGVFVIGTAHGSFMMEIGGELEDLEVPGAIIFKLQNQQPSNPLMLSDLIGQFTQLDLADVPVLNAIGFNNLQFWVVDDPQGFTIGDYKFPLGIGVVADIFIYSWEAKFNLQVAWDSGIIASGSINNPIALGGIFVLSDTTGETGPSGSINTTSISARAAQRRTQRLLSRSGDSLGLADAAPYITLDGKVEFLGITESIAAQASGSSFDFQLAFDFLDVVTATLDCSLVDDKNFAASASFTFDLDVTLGPYAVAGVTLIPEVHIVGPGAALSLAIAINPTVIAALSVGLDFSWGSLPEFDLEVSITLGDIANDLSNLYQAVIDWMKANVGAVFEKILSDAGAWVQALETTFLELAGDIDAVANALANYFGTAVADAAGYLKQLGFEFESIVDALVTYFKIAYAEAAQIVEGLWEDCAMGNAFSMASPGQPAPFSVNQFQYALTSTRGGQRLLLLRHGYGEEIWALLSHRPHLRRRLAALGTHPRGANDLRRLIDTVLMALIEVAPRASGSLRAEIDAAVPGLFARRHLGHREFLQSLST